jgi:demethylmenaquinone methyltransferase/2-methoxy-6-polyprenyl-1,4-benzoquinol methylase
MMPSTLDDNETAHAEAVKAMFSGIAGRYDLLNHLLSLNIDKSWRRKVRARLADILESEDAVVLDVACGTGDLALELQRGAAAKVIGTDFCRPMLEIARQKNGTGTGHIPYIEGDAMELPFADGSFDAVTIAFGLRNLPNYASGLKEFRRVLKPTGKLAILECSSPSVPGFREVYKLYFERILPHIGGMISGNRGAYTYLPNSVSKFPDKETLMAMMNDAGFTNVGFQSLTGGTAAIHTGIKQ